MFAVSEWRKIQVSRLKTLFGPNTSHSWEFATVYSLETKLSYIKCKRGQLQRLCVRKMYQSETQDLPGYNCSKSSAVRGIGFVIFLASRCKQQCSIHLQQAKTLKLGRNLRAWSDNGFLDTENPSLNTGVIDGKNQHLPQRFCRSFRHGLTLF